MGKSMTRGEIQDLIGKFATENPGYRSALLSDPKSIIERQLNTSLGDVSVKAVEDSADVAYVVVPYAPAEGELQDADLEKVAGGFMDKNAECEGGVLNTFVQLSL
jgi:hypothetical protein